MVLLHNFSVYITSIFYQFNIENTIFNHAHNFILKTKHGLANGPLLETVGFSRAFTSIHNSIYSMDTCTSTFTHNIMRPFSDSWFSWVKAH